MALRFAVSPLWETIAGLRVPAAPGLSPVHQRWIACAENRLLPLGADASPPHHLVTRPVVPEFLIPTPGVRSDRVEVEIDAIAEATPERIAAAVDDPRLRSDPATAITAMQERLHAVHDAIIAPVWSRLEGVLRGDVERRGRRLVEAGGPTVPAELHPEVSYRVPHLTVAERTVDIGERDLVLVPSAFTGSRTPGHARLPPRQSRPLGAVLPGARLRLALGAVGRAHPRRPGRLVGPTRARLLCELERPSTVTELATRLGVTVGAVSQHPGVLRAAGLAVSRREGREVVSLRTGLGLALVQGEVP
ncbi:ArsR/SmtB family transcription factor [Actinosynnema sp. NPDC091369]